MASLPKDFRRTDVRNYQYESPYWVTSKDIDLTLASGRKAILFSFPNDGQVTLIDKIICQVVQKPNHVSNGSAARIGLGYLSTDSFSSGTALAGCVSSVLYLNSADGAILVSAALSSVICYGRRATTGMLSALSNGCVVSSKNMIIGDATNVPCIYLTIAAGSTAFTQGKLRVHVLLSNIPMTVARA